MTIPKRNKTCQILAWNHHRGRTARRHYWPRKRIRFDFSDGKICLTKYADTLIKRHIKVRGEKSPFDGGWAYWINRLGRDPSKPGRLSLSKPKQVVTLLKRQEGRCTLCGLHFMSEDHIKTHLRNGNHNDSIPFGGNMPANLVLLHGHSIPFEDCHDEVHRTKHS